MRRIPLPSLLSLASVLAVASCGTGADLDGVDGAVLSVREKIACGGFAGLACPDGMQCVDDPTDKCDPDQGGADCIGYCKRESGKNGTGGGKRHCRSTSDKTYVAVGDECAAIHFICAEGFEPFFDTCGCGCQAVQGEACNQVTCGSGEFCCNYSCSICAPTGGFCTEQLCTSL